MLDTAFRVFGETTGWGRQVPVREDHRRRYQGEDVMYCRICGAGVMAGERVCPNCGEALYGCRREARDKIRTLWTVLEVLLGAAALGAILTVHREALFGTPPVGR